MNKRKLFLQRLLLLIEKNINYKQNKFRSYKPNKGYTSELDIKVNNFLFKSIKEYFPNDTIISEESLKINSLDIINLANSEGLHSHANSVKIRFED